MDQEVLVSIDNQEEDFATMLEQSFKDKESNKIVEGVIVEIQENNTRALIDVGEKLEGIVSCSEISDEEGNLLFNVGDSLNVMILGYANERPKISYKKVLEIESTQKFVEENKDKFEDITINGVVKKKNRGGFIVEADNVSFFMPKSLAAFRADENVIGRKIKVKVVKVDEEQNSIVVSRRKFLNEEKKKRKALVDALLEEDKIVEGTIKKITSYGMFVDVGGIDGLVHYNEISYKGPVNPAKYYKEGEEVEVRAIDYDKDKKHLSLSIKAVMPDPWKEVEEELDEGDTITVHVSNIEPYGAFVDLGNDIEGFLHISEITWNKNIKNPKDFLTVGQELDVEVIEIDPKKHKLRVSLKRLLPKPFDEFCKNNKEGDVVTGKITTLTDFGAFVQIDNVEGLLHNQDASWDKNSKCRELFKIGDEVEVKIVKINRNDEKISLNRKSLCESPVENFAKKHKTGEIVKGTIRDVKEFGAFVSLEPQVDGLIRTEDLFPLKAEELEAGQEIEAVITVVDVAKERIRLSVRKLERIKEQEVLKEINQQNDTSNSLGELIKDQLK